MGSLHGLITKVQKKSNKSLILQCGLDSQFFLKVSLYPYLTCNGNTYMLKEI